MLKLQYNLRPTFHKFLLPNYIVLGDVSGVFPCKMTYRCAALFANMWSKASVYESWQPLYFWATTTLTLHKQTRSSTVAGFNPSNTLNTEQKAAGCAF